MTAGRTRLICVITMKIKTEFNCLIAAGDARIKFT